MALPAWSASMTQGPAPVNDTDPPLLTVHRLPRGPAVDYGPGRPGRRAGTADSRAGLQWISDAFSLVFASLLPIIAGSVGDPLADTARSLGRLAGR